MISTVTWYNYACAPVTALKTLGLSVLTRTYVLHMLLTSMHILVAGVNMFMNMFLAHTGMFLFEIC